MASSAADGVAKASGSTALGEWRYGWPVALAAFTGFMLLSLKTMATGAFMAPMEAEFQWSRAEFSLGYSVGMLPGFFLPPLFGILLDRYGPRVIAVLGALAGGLTYSLLATATGSIANWVLLWVLAGAATQMAGITLWTGATARAFLASRGLALTIVMCGTAAAATAAPLMANWLIERYEFRTALVAMGAVWGGTVALLSWFGLRRISGGRGPAVQTAPDPSPAAAPAKPVTGLTVSEGLRSSFFYKLMLIITVSYGVVLSLTLHLIPMLSASGLTRGTAVMLAGFYGIALIIGKVLVGLALDRLTGRMVAALTNVVLVASLAMLAVPNPGIAWSMVAVLLLGVAYGSIGPIVPYLATRYFGMRSYGRLFGLAACAYAAAASAGPFLAGYVYDLTKGYQLFLLGNIPLALIAIVVCLTLGPYPDFEKRES